MFEHQFTCTTCHAKSLHINAPDRDAAIATVTTVLGWHDDHTCGKCKPKKRRKYNNNITVLDGAKFDSDAERDYYEYLKQLQVAGEITDLKLQQTFELLPAFRDATGKKHRSIKYIADFTYRRGGALVVCEVKGSRTAVYNLKEKLFLFKYPTVIFEVIEKPKPKTKRKAA